MRSESAHMSSAAEARFRVQEPNSLPRSIKIVALDERSETRFRELTDGAWTINGVGSHFSQTLLTDIENADMVVLLASPGRQSQMASIIGEACQRQRIMITSLILGARSASEHELSQTLADVRPWSHMVVIANADEYVRDMLVALRA